MWPAQVASYLHITTGFLEFPRLVYRILKTDEPWLSTPACSETVCCLKTQLMLSPTLPHFKQPTQHLWHMMTLIGAAMSELQGNWKKILPLPPVHSVLWSNPVPWVCERCWHASELVNAGTHTCMGTNSPWSLTLPLQPDATQAKPLCPLSRVIQFLSPV